MSKQHIAHVIVGSSYGDEGKGQVTSTLCKNKEYHTLNVLTNGGSQRGHTVIDTYDNGEKSTYHVYHHFGSGTMYGTDNLFASEFILNPMNFCRELNDFYRNSFDISNIAVYRMSDCRWSTPYDMLANQIIEEYRDKNRHGSVGVGIWETVKRFSETDKNLSFGDFMAMDIASKTDYLKSIRDYCYQRIIQETCSEIPEKFAFIYSNEGLLNRFIVDCDIMYQNTTEIKNPPDILGKYDQLVFENGQGLLLSDDPENVHTTPSKTGCEYAINFLTEYAKGSSVCVHYTTRPYVTRHGAGPLKSECAKEKAAQNISAEITNIANDYQGGLRYAKLDPGSLYERVISDFSYAQNNRKDLAFTGLLLDITHANEDIPASVALVKKFGSYPTKFHANANT